MEIVKKDRAKCAHAVISKVRTLNGLYFLEEISDDIDLTRDDKYLEIMQRLRTTILAIPEQVSDLMQDFPNSKYQIVLEAEFEARREAEAAED